MKTPIIGQNPEPAAPADTQAQVPGAGDAASGDAAAQAPEHGGRGGLDPVRYGDWEKNGRCIDF